MIFTAGFFAKVCFSAEAKTRLFFAINIIFSALNEFGINGSYKKSVKKSRSKARTFFYSFFRVVENNN